MSLHSQFWNLLIQDDPCLVDVDVNCSGFMEAGSRRSLGLLPMANSIGAPTTQSYLCVFSTLLPSRINWAGVICARMVWSTFFEAVSTSAERNFLNNPTPSQLGLAKERGSVFMLCIR